MIMRWSSNPLAKKLLIKFLVTLKDSESDRKNKKTKKRKILHLNQHKKKRKILKRKWFL